MRDNPGLAYFQAQLLALLSEDLSPEEVLQRLKMDPLLAEFSEYLSCFQPNMVAVAQELVKKWGRQSR